MADRTVKVTLIAQANQYIAGIDQAARKTRELGSEAEKLAQKRQAFELLGRGLLTIGVAGVAALGLAVAKTAEFEQAMSNANAVLDETPDGLHALREAALAAGGATVFTAKESANAIEELAKAGISTADILGGALTGSLDLAASGQLGVARAAEITGISLKQFGLDGSQAARVADVLSAGANKAVGSVEDLAQGLKFVGPVAANMNVSLEDTVATLTLFADRGVIGEQAGTSFRGMLSSLTSPSKLAQKELERLGITLYDANGKFLGMENAAGQLQKALGGVTDAERDMSLGILFGNQQITAARILVDAGAETWNEYRDAVEDSGIAARIAEERMNNLAGDVEKLGGALDTALIGSGSAANDVLRTLTQSVTSSIDAFNDMPVGVQQAVFWVTAAATAASLAGGAFFLAVPKVAQFNQAIATMSPGVQRAAGVLGALGKAAGFVGALVAVATVLNQIGSAGRAAAKGVEETYQIVRKEGLDALFTGLSGDVHNFHDALELLTGDSVNSQIERLGSVLNIFGFADQVRDTRQQFDTLGQSLAGLVNSGDADRASALFQEMAIRASAQGVSTSELLDLMPAYKEALAGVSNSTEELTSADADLAVQQTVVIQQLEALSEALAETDAAFIDSLGAYDVAVEKNRAWAQETADATEEAEDSWEDYYDGVTVTVSQYLDELQRMVDAQNNWEANMLYLAGRVSQETIDELARMGPEGAPLVAQLVNASDDELARMESLFAEKSENATGAFTSRLISAQPVIEAAAAQLGEGAAREIADKLARGQATIPEIMAQYNLELANNPMYPQVNTGPALQAIQDLKNSLAAFQNSNYGINISGYINSLDRYAGGFEDHMTQAFASGGLPSGIYSGGPIYKFAEPHLPWEAFISPLPQYREQNYRTWNEVGDRLGFFREPQQSGGLRAAQAQASGPVDLTDSTIERLGAKVAQQTRVADRSGYGF